jgi:hypothetical protein
MIKKFTKGKTVYFTKKDKIFSGKLETLTCRSPKFGPDGVIRVGKYSIYQIPIEKLFHDRSSCVNNLIKNNLEL